MKNEDLLKEIVPSESQLKEVITNYVGNFLNPESDVITVEQIIDVFAEQFPEFLFVVAEENWINGYTQALNDLKYIESEIALCGFGNSNAMDGELNCSNYNTSSGAFNIMQALANVRSLRGSVTPNVDEGVLKSFRNPYDTSLPCIRSRFEFRPGQVSISTNGTKLQLRACFKTGCGSADIASKDIDVSQR